MRRTILGLAAAACLAGTAHTDRAGFFQRPSGRTLFSKTGAVAVGN